MRSGWRTFRYQLYCAKDAGAAKESARLFTDRLLPAMNSLNLMIMIAKPSQTPPRSQFFRSRHSASLHLFAKFPFCMCGMYVHYRLCDRLQEHSQSAILRLIHMRRNRVGVPVRSQPCSCKGYLENRTSSPEKVKHPAKPSQPASINLIWHSEISVSDGV